ncbi:putative PurR-regulated permease PerM [Planomicrobium koreense]|jgi:predicted PurR-regulated permease PerM|uniref:Putative PurR-regulated permease PerM n=1 Tax=Planococcus koreensis TaxID=112331 RepID=A0A7W8CSE5_9BACL|nr:MULTISPECIES: YjzD family protein [Planococcus]MBB5179120.1 putative PurR-regulated permease PerM [Planococcus koreensis]MDN3450287.1 YjzD family protein [Planococcus sp. APC 3906]
MQFLGTFFWSFLLISLLNYVVSAVQNVPFDFMVGVYISVAVSVLIFVLSSLIPDGPAPEKH